MSLKPFTIYNSKYVSKEIHRYIKLLKNADISGIKFEQISVLVGKQKRMKQSREFNALLRSSYFG